MKTIKLTIRRFKYGIKNLIKWFPIIWKDRDWDDSYIFTILENKLKFQADYIGTKDRHVNAKRDAEVMMTCVRLIKLVKEETYLSEYVDYHKTKYWFEPIEDKPGYSTWESQLQSENFDEYFKKYPLIYKRVLNGEGIMPLHNEFEDYAGFSEEEKEQSLKLRVALNISSINHDRARKLLFKIIEQNIEKWWD